MEVVLGLHLDGKRSWKKRNAFNRLVLGPSGFLSQLELYLGLSAKRQVKLQRVIHVRKVLKLLDNGHRFYSRSMKIDDFGVASELLEWRDELYLHGWNGRFRQKPLSGKLADLAEVEAVLGRENFSPGNGERLAAVADALQSLRTPVTSIELLEPLERHPLRWQQVIRLFPCYFCKSFETPGAPEGSALYALQQYLLSPESLRTPEHIEPDNSLSVVTADTALTAAHHVARELQARCDDVLLIDGGEGEVFDQVLEAEGYPRQALQGCEESLPALQLLPLLLRLRRFPLDVAALLAFLTLPEKLSPLDPALSERCARVFARFPGTGGPQWQRVLGEYRAQRGNAGDESVDELHRWIEGHKVGYDDPMPLPELKACAGMVREFFSRKKDEGEQKEAQSLFSGGCEQAAVFEAAVDELLEQGEKGLGSYQVDQLLTQASSGIRYQHQREAGSVPDTSHPGAVGELFTHVVWWWAAAPAMEERLPWSADERLFLEREGVLFPSQDQVLAWQAADWLRPVLSARQSFLLVLPPEGDERHPLWLKIVSFIPSIPVVQIEDHLGVSEGGMKMSVAGYDLPGKRLFWKIPEGIPLSGRVFSPTALEMLITAPSRWFLENVARITPSRLLELSEGPLLYGLLAHRLVEQLVSFMQAGEKGISDFDSWFKTAFTELVQKEGAVLLMPGKSAELETLRYRLRLAIGRLLPVLQKYGAGVMHAEYGLEGSLNGLRMLGRADLVLFDRNNAPSVIDMKWGRGEERRKSLLQGMHIQLLAYAAMVQEETGRWPSLVYYILKNGRFLATGEGCFTSGELVRKQKDEQSEALWQRVTRSFVWRMDQMREGTLFVGGESDTDDPMPMPPDEGLTLTRKDDPYNPYRFLEGWEVAE